MWFSQDLRNKILVSRILAQLVTSQNIIFKVAVSSKSSTHALIEVGIRAAKSGSFCDHRRVT